MRTLAEDNRVISSELEMYNLEDAYERLHLWGNEQWLVNNDHYCAKVLTVNDDFQSSMHYHKHKTETFICLDGIIQLIIVDTDNNESNNILEAGDIITIPKGVMHSFSGDGVILEVSTPDDNDNVKKIPARKRMVK